MNLKKSLHSVVFSFFIAVISFTPHIWSVDKRVLVYSHGFGENDPDIEIGPTYPDAPGQMGKACFYTRSAVTVLADYLKNAVDNGAQEIDMIARSCGAGTAINCIHKLATYEQNTDYFKGTRIKSTEDALQVIGALNKGTLNFTVPFLSLKKANAIAISSDVLSKASIGIAFLAAYKWGLFDKILTMLGIKSAQWKKIITALLLGLATSYMAGPHLKNGYSFLMDKFVVPYITNYHYDPSHITPMEAAQGLRNAITCPVLIHVCKDDRVLENPDKDTINFYNAFRKQGHEEDTHIVVSTDSWHNSDSQQYEDAQADFYKKYRDHEEIDLETNLSLKELREKIYS